MAAAGLLPDPLPGLREALTILRGVEGVSFVEFGDQDVVPVKSFFSPVLVAGRNFLSGSG